MMPVIYFSVLWIPIKCFPAYVLVLDNSVRSAGIDKVDFYGMMGRRKCRKSIVTNIK